jgi:hypothetical protein
MRFFLEESLFFAPSLPEAQDVLLWKMIARHHYEVQLTVGTPRVFRHFHGFEFFLFRQ